MATKLKKGDVVKISANPSWYCKGTSNPIGINGEIVSVNELGLPIEVNWSDGTSNSYVPIDLELITKKQKNMTEQQMKNAVKKVAKELAKANNTITTLEIKNELRIQYPTINWTQYATSSFLGGFDSTPGVSDLFHELVDEGEFVSVADNGTFQTYADAKTGKTVVVKASPAVNVGITIKRGLVKGSVIALAAGKKAAATRAANKGGDTGKKGNRISKTKAYDLMKSNKGHFFTAVFTKKDGTTRTINCQYVSDQKSSPLGYVLVKESRLLKSKDKEPIRNLNLQTLQTLKIGGSVYSTK